MNEAIDFLEGKETSEEGKEEDERAMQEEEGEMPGTTATNAMPPEETEAPQAEEKANPQEGPSFFLSFFLSFFSRTKS